MLGKELNRLYYLRRLIAREKERLEVLNSHLMNTGMNFSGLPRGESTDAHRLELAVAELIAAKEKIDKKKEEYAREQMKLEKYINSVEDLRMRYILTLRFVDMNSYRQIARKLGGGNTEDSVRMSIKRFLQKG